MTQYSIIVTAVTNRNLYDIYQMVSYPINLKQHYLFYQRHVNFFPSQLSDDHWVQVQSDLVKIF